MHRHRAGFTHVELMIVMTLLAIMALGVVPVFRGSLANARADHAARDLFAEIKAAQESAVSEGVEYRVYFDLKQNSYWPARPGITKEGERGFLPVDVPGGEAIRAPDRLVIDDVKGRRGESRNSVYLAFYPTGVGDVGRIKLYDGADRRRRFVIETNGTRASISFPDEDR